MREWRDTLAERGARLWTDIAWHLIVAVRGRRLLGVATGNYLGNVNIGMVGYLVVDPAERAGGLGTRLRRRLKETFRADARRVLGRELTAVIGEVRRDNPWLRALIRNPATLALDFQYLQPRLHRGDSLTPLVLYYEGVARRRYRLPVDFLRRLLYTTWRRIYRIDRPLASPVFRRMLANLARRRSVGETAMWD